ncbi:MAG TPA: hypothetical protein VL053_05480 [Arachidicoccus sp.]|nr:hypothetical protein [Arachidicoccus sp.]
MKKTMLTCLIFSLSLVGCQNKTENAKAESKNQSSFMLSGTWKLVSAIIIENGDSTITNYSGDTTFIKIINDTHFAFLQHDLHKGKDSTAVFGAGGGPYTLKDDSLYTEHLAYCNARAWEGNDFTFVVKISNDTLIQKGVEKIDKLGVNRINIEKYTRVR